MFSDDFRFNSVYNFNDVVPETLAGWGAINLSEPQGEKIWFIGGAAILAAFDGDPSDYFAANFGAASDSGTISLWVISPVVEF